jgi:outer membrane protein, heavy metal efflux system
MRQFKPTYIFAIAGVVACLMSGCRTPSWFAYRSLRCIPESADGSSRAFWEVCADTDAKPQASDEKVTEPPKVERKSPAAVESERNTSRTDSSLRSSAAVRLASFSQSGSPSDLAKSDRRQDPLRLPTEIPGADTPPINLPRTKPDGSKLDADSQRVNILKLFPELPELPDEPDAFPDPSMGATGLEELQRLARENHPGLKAASAAVEAAYGLMIQSGLPPNPNVGYEADTVRTLNTPGYHGAYIQQTFITAQKLGLAAQAAAVDHANAQVALRKTWITVASNVRRTYFQVLAARRRIVLAKAQYEYSERAYQAQIKLVVAGESAPYEPLQLRVLTTQARATLIQAQQNSIAAWRSLAAAVAVPSMAPAPIDGRIDCPAPNISYEQALDQMLAVHTDIRTAENLISKNRSLVTLADRTPIPNVDVGFVLQRDYTFEPGATTYNLMVGGEVPVWNRNQGNRIATRAELVKATQLVTDTENQLISKLATTYASYKSNRQLADSFRTDALSDQVRAYRGIYQRYLTDPSGIGFNDVIVAQQTVAGLLNQYLDILQSQWQSTVDLGELLQAEDLFAMGELVSVAEIPAL